MAKTKKKLRVKPNPDAQQVLDNIAEFNEAALYPTDMKDAVIGIVERFGQPPLVLLTQPLEPPPVPPQPGRPDAGEPGRLLGVQRHQLQAQRDDRIGRARRQSAELLLCGAGESLDLHQPVVVSAVTVPRPGGAIRQQGKT